MVLRKADDLVCRTAQEAKVCQSLDVTMRNLSAPYFQQSIEQNID